MASKIDFFRGRLFHGPKGRSFQGSIVRNCSDGRLRQTNAGCRFNGIRATVYTVLTVPVGEFALKKVAKAKVSCAFALPLKQR